MKIEYTSKHGDPKKDGWTFEPLGQDTMESACISLARHYAARYTGSLNVQIVRATRDIICATQREIGTAYSTAHGALIVTLS